MAEVFKIWLHCERCDNETGDGLGDVDLPFGESATRDTQEQAIDFARKLHQFALAQETADALPPADALRLIQLAMSGDQDAETFNTIDGILTRAGYPIATIG
jgi:hypothetical protein